MKGRRCGMTLLRSWEQLMLFSLWSRSRRGWKLRPSVQSREPRSDSNTRCASTWKHRLIIQFIITHTHTHTHTHTNELTNTLLPRSIGGSGLLDPCEKEGVDAASSLSAQERVDLTVSAQASHDHSLTSAHNCSYLSHHHLPILKFLSTFSSLYFDSCFPLACSSFDCVQQTSPCSGHWPTPGLCSLQPWCWGEGYWSNGGGRWG